MTDQLTGKISPHLVVGLEGLELTEREREIFSRTPPAGVIILARNVESVAQLQALVSEVRELVIGASGMVPLVMADHEGGRISVLARAVGIPPSQMASCKQGDISIFRGQLRETALRIRQCGINMALSPVADINSEYLNPVIGTRAFAEGENDTSSAVAEAVRVFSEEGLLTSVKHFPGHGSSTGDSHLMLPVLGKTIDQLREKDLIPFREGIAAGADTVMTAHIAPSDRGLPSSLDPFVVIDILRGELGFEGVVITDGLEMAGILTGSGFRGGAKQAVRELAAGKASEGICGSCSTEETVILKPAVVIRSALEAGNDLLLFSRPAEQVYDELKAVLAVLDEDEDFWEGAFIGISEKSRERILALRRRASRLEVEVPGYLGPGIAGSNQKTGAYALVAERVVRIGRDPGGLLPFTPSTSLVPVFCGEKADFAYYPVKEFILKLSEKLCCPAHFQVEKLRSCMEAAMPRSCELINLYKYVPCDDLSGKVPVLVLLGRRPISADDMKELSCDYRVIIAAERPWAEKMLPPEKTVIVCYGTWNESAEAAGDIIMGSNR